MFFQNIFRNQKHVINQFKQGQKLFCPVIVNNYLCNFLCKFMIKVKSTWRCKIKDQTLQMTLLYCGRTVRSSHQRCSIKKVVFLNFAIFTGKHQCWGLFLLKSQALLFKRDSNTNVSCGYCKIFKTTCFEKHLQKATS